MISKVALITGGSSGIGEGTAHKYAREGAKVILMARGQERGQAVEDAIRSDGYEATFIPCDVSDEDSVVVAVGAAADTYGAINVLVNNASGGGGEVFPDETTEEWDRIIRANLYSAFFMSRAVWPHLIEAGGGAVINMSSVAAQRGITPTMYDEFGATTSAYWAAKAGVEALTRQMAGIGGKHNIRVNCIRPGQILTPGATGRHGNIGALNDTSGQHHYFEKWFDKIQIVPGPGYPEDVANLVFFLASDEARFITCEMINVDGGCAVKI